MYNNQSFSRFRKVNIWEKMVVQNPILLCLLIGLCSVVAHSDLVLVSVVSTVLILLLLIFRTDIGAMLWLVMVLLTPDREIYKLLAPDTWLISNTFFINGLGGFTFIVVITLLAFGFFLCNLMVSSCRVHKLLLLFLLPLAIPLHGFLYATDMRIAVSDLRYLVAPIAMFLALKASGISVQGFLAVFNIALIVKAVTILVFSYFLTEPGITYWGYTAYLLPLILLLNYDKPLFIKIILTGIVLVCILTFPARGRIFCFLYTLIIMFFVAGPQYRRVLSVAIGVILIVIIPWLMANFGDESSLRFIKWKLTTFNVFSSESSSANMRLLEFLNIMREQIQFIYPVFIGNGYGGYFVDSFISFDYNSILGGSAFPDEHIINRTFFDPHSNINFMLLKAGLLPSLVFFGGLVYFAFIRKYHQVDLRARYLMFFLPLLGVIMVAIKASLVFGAFMFVLNQLLFTKNRI